MTPQSPSASMRISRQAFLQSLLILLALMVAAGMVTRTVPAGTYARVEHQGRQIIDPLSFHTISRPDYPIWRWFVAPIEVLFGPDGLTVIVIIIFLLFIGVSFSVLERSGILKLAVSRIVLIFGHRKYILLAVIAFLFMLLGAFFGILEEIVPLVPMMIALAHLLGWDTKVGLGMSVLATNMGFSAAITNPFTIGVAQEIAELPLFSGFWLRIGIFAAIYLVLVRFLIRHARRIEKAAKTSTPANDGTPLSTPHTGPESVLRLSPHSGTTSNLRRSVIWFLATCFLILVTLIVGPFIPGLSDLALPIVGLLFLMAGLGAGLLSGQGTRQVLSSAGHGLLSIAPAIPLILMAASVKHIIVQGDVLDTILHHVAAWFPQASPLTAALLVLALSLIIEFFVSSGSAKALLIMPIIVPLADLIGITRQVAVTAYCFGDGFSNTAYPTNPVLLICLGLAAVSYGTWIRWTARLWVWVILVSVGFLALAVAIGYGPH